MLLLTSAAGGEFLDGIGGAVAGAEASVRIAAIMFGGLLDRVETYLDTREGTALMTLVGRTEIWNVALEEWRNHPAFGYGLTIWDLDYRAQIGIPSATHAHNQLYQSLASAGVTGVVGLTIYTATLLWFVLKTAKASHGLTLALFLLLFNYSISEVPLSMSSYGPPQLMHLLLLMVVASTLALSKGLGTRQKVVLQEESRCFSR